MNYAQFIQEKLLKIEAEVAELEEQRNAGQAQKAPQEAALKAEKEAAVTKKKELIAEKSDLKVCLLSLLFPGPS